MHLETDAEGYITQVVDSISTRTTPLSKAHMDASKVNLTNHHFSGAAMPLFVIVSLMRKVILPTYKKG